MNDILQTPIEYLKGVGPSRGEMLRKELNIHRYGDLLTLFPNRYIDRTRYYKINELQAGNTEVQIMAKSFTSKPSNKAKAEVAWLPPL
jgi:ATP-dependent DNA helicase RecG